MEVKNTLKTIKLNESMISMFLGAVVIIVAGLLVVNLLNKRQVGTNLPTGEIADSIETEYKDKVDSNGNRIHVVQENDNLWKIAEKYYESGYNWVDIAEGNNLNTGDVLAEGQELIIPNVDPKAKTVASSDIAETLADDNSQKVAGGTKEATPTPTEKIEDKVAQTTTKGGESISDSTYTVVKGDTLWDIAQRAYGDPYRWSDIAKANSLVNPNLIHPGNALSLPR